MQTMTPSELRALLTAQDWAQFQVFGIPPNRHIRLDLVGAVRDVVVDDSGWARVRHAAAFYAVNEREWRRKSYDQYNVPGNMADHGVHRIGPNRLALVLPGPETITTVLFAKSDDGRSEQVFPGFHLGPIDLSKIVLCERRTRKRRA